MESTLQIPARDAYAYGRSILEALFTKDDLSKSDVVQSPKSKKPPLDKANVELMFGRWTFHILIVLKCIVCDI